MPLSPRIRRQEKQCCESDEATRKTGIGRPMIESNGLNELLFSTVEKSL